MEEDLNITDATLLPLAEVPVPSVQLGTFLEQDLLVLFSGLCLYLRETQLRMRCGPVPQSPNIIFTSKTCTFKKKEVPLVGTLLAQSECPHY